MKFIVNQHYIDGPLDGQIIPFDQWSNDVNHIVVEHGGTKHLYSRRSRWHTNSPFKDTSVFFGECSVRYFGEWKECLNQKFERELPYMRTRDLHDEKQFNQLFESASSYVKTFHPGVPILLLVQTECPTYTFTEVVHAKVDPLEIKDFLEFARDCRWDAKHDDVQRERQPVGARK